MLQTPTAQVKTVAQGANLDGPNGERTGRPGRGSRGRRDRKVTMVTTSAKVARNLTRSFFEIGHKRCNSSDHISMSEICARELRATLLGNQPDWKPTHETAAWVHWYNTRRPHLALGGITPQQAENQHTTTRKEAASTSLHKTRDLTRRVRVRRPASAAFGWINPRT